MVSPDSDLSLTMRQALKSPQDALTFVLDGLAAKSKGQNYDWAAMGAAGEFLAMLSMVKSGIALPQVEEHLDRDHSIKFSYSEADGLSISIIFEDGEEDTDLTFTVEE